MKATVSIGDFSRMTHLSIKTLRHYHDVGLLAPAEIDKMTGYRYYAKSQVPTAQVIRRFRGLGMPVEEVRSILAASDPHLVPPRHSMPPGGQSEDDVSNEPRRAPARRYRAST